ncbi:MAG: GxxExxY protein [Chloroflexi bacterium]|nr:GxxExxY protein [Chloroflexota bacterium]
MELEQLTEQIIGAAYEVHRVLGPGFLEKVYRNALQIELEMRGIQAQREVDIDVHYKGHVVGTYAADLLVENCLIVEVKAVQNLVKEHEVQLVNYLTATKIEDGLLINFGGFSVELKHKYRTYRPKK